MPDPPPATPRRPTVVEAALPLAAAAVLLAVGYAALGWRIEVMLLASAAVAGLVGRRQGYDWKAMETGIIEALATALPAVFILITVGALIASWIAAGTIPLLVTWGLELMSPRFFLVTTCVICSIVSVFTGTSWGTAGTVGVALMGVAGGLGVSAPAAAGAVVAGAYFGDKLSPFSDTTNLAPVVARSNLFDHIRWLLWSTGPAWLLGLGIYLVVGLGAGTSAAADVEALQTVLRGAFRFNLLLLLPPVVMLAFAVRGMPILPGMLLSTALGGVLAVWIQGAPVAAVLEATVSGYQPDTGGAPVDALLARGGMLAMMDLVLLVLCAFGFAGILRSASGTFMAGTLGVATVSYAPWAVLNYTGVLFALLLAATGVGIAPRTRDDETRPGS